MQEKFFFLIKIQQVRLKKMMARWGLTEKEAIIAWNYEENRAGSGVFSKLLFEFLPNCYEAMHSPGQLSPPGACLPADLCFVPVEL
jgi:hypothetical protein